jgi:hypothetical protein
VKLLAALQLYQKEVSKADKPWLPDRAARQDTSCAVELKKRAGCSFADPYLPVRFRTGCGRLPRTYKIKQDKIRFRSLFRGLEKPSPFPFLFLLPKAVPARTAFFPPQTWDIMPAFNPGGYTGMIGGVNWVCFRGRVTGSIPDLPASLWEPFSVELLILNKGR